MIDPKLLTKLFSDDSYQTWDELCTALEKARDELPTCPVIAFLLARALLQAGRIQEGLKEAEKRFNPLTSQSPQGNVAYNQMTTFGEMIRKYSKPIWVGKSDLNGKGIIIFNEGGYGDTIQNIRFLPKLKALGARIILEVEQELADLVRNAEGVDELAVFPNKVIRLFSSKKKLCERADYIVSSQSLMYHFSPTLDDVCFHFPYLKPQQKENKAIDVIKASPARLKLGFVWSGNIGNFWNNYRSVDKGYFHHLSKIAQLFSLQKGNVGNFRDECKSVNEIAKCNAELDYIDLAPYINNFNDTANIMQSLDGIVSVDTSVVHLAGALNIPVWVMMTKKWAEWRWQKRWYDSATVIQGDDWDAIMEATVTSVQEHFNENH